MPFHHYIRKFYYAAIKDKRNLRFDNDLPLYRELKYDKIKHNKVQIRGLCNERTLSNIINSVSYN